jgi:hypothetical protein
VNFAEGVNITELTPQELERLLMSRLKEILGTTYAVGAISSRTVSGTNQGIDGIAMVNIPDGPKVVLLIECKSQPRPSQVPPAPGPRSADFPAVAIEKKFEHGKLREVRAWVFAAPSISERMAEVCVEHGWSWFDLAGNCQISVPGVLSISHRGKPPVHVAARPDANLGTAEAARVLRALLLPERLATHWTQRELREFSYPNVSLGLVNKIVAHLRNEHYLEYISGDGFRVAEPEKLLLAWRDAYRFDRIKQQQWFTLLRESQVSDVIRKHQLPVAWAAFSAASRQAPTVRQPRMWLMANDEHVEALRDALEAKSVDTGANVTVLVPPDAGYLRYKPEEDQAGPCTHPVQTYVDVWHAGGRGQEAAEAVLTQRLRPEWAKRKAP